MFSPAEEKFLTNRLSAQSCRHITFPNPKKSQKSGQMCPKHCKEQQHGLKVSFPAPSAYQMRAACRGTAITHMHTSIFAARTQLGRSWHTCLNCTSHYHRCCDSPSPFWQYCQELCPLSRLLISLKPKYPSLAHISFWKVALPVAGSQLIARGSASPQQPSSSAPPQPGHTEPLQSQQHRFTVSAQFSNFHIAQPWGICTSSKTACGGDAWRALITWEQPLKQRAQTSPTTTTGAAEPSPAAI